MDRSFSIKSFYKHLTKKEDNDTRFPIRKLRKMKALPECLFLLGLDFCEWTLFL